MSTTEDFPESIGPYLPLRLLGRGGMGEVYHCVDERGVEVAVKWLHRTKASSRRRFDKEMAAMKAIQHPRLVRLLASGEHNDRPYAVLEYVEGQELSVYARKLRLRPAQERIREVRRIGVALCDALEVLHRHGVVHRDVKPSNVLLTRSGDVRLADLGVIRDLNDPSTAVQGRLIGTAAYAPPEQSRGEEVDHTADLYALGCTLFTVLTGRRPYPQKDRKDAIRAHRRSPVPHARTLDPAVPEKMDKVLARLMAKDPRDRYGTARAARSALARSGPSGAPAPLAGRRRYVDQVAAALEANPQGVVVRPQGPRGSGRGWLLEIIEELAVARGRSVVIAREKSALTRGLKRLTQEGLVLGTRLNVPAGVPVVEVPLHPLGLAEVRRSVVSVATRTPDPHVVAERLHRATAGHPGWLIPLLEGAFEGVLTLPDELPVPGELNEAVEDLDEPLLETLAALSVLGAPSSVKTLSDLCGRDCEQDLQRLHAEGLVQEMAGAWRPMGSLTAQAARANHLDIQLLEEKARGLADQPIQKVDALEELLRQGRRLLDAGRATDARPLLEDASAMAHAQDRPLERRASHVLRAEATLMMGGHAAASAAADRLHRALSRIKVDEDPGWRALALGLRARLAARRGDTRSYQRTLATFPRATSNELRLRAGLHLAWAALENGDPTDALERAQTVGAEAVMLGWPTLADAASQVAQRARG